MKKFCVASEHIEAGRWGARGPHDPDDEIILSYSKEEVPVGGCDYEFMIEYHTFNAGGGALRLGVYSDAFAALDTCPEVFDLLKQSYYNRRSGKTTREDFDNLCNDLERLGWVRQHPEPKPKPECCDKCHRAFDPKK